MKKKVNLVFWVTAIIIVFSFLSYADETNSSDTLNFDMSVFDDYTSKGDEFEGTMSYYPDPDKDVNNSCSVKSIEYKELVSNGLFSSEWVTDTAYYLVDYLHAPLSACPERMPRTSHPFAGTQKRTGYRLDLHCGAPAG